MGEVAKKEQPLGIVRAEDAPMVAMIERIAMDPSIPIDRLEQMLAMKERMDAKAAEKAFAAAFAKMQAALPVIRERGEIKNKDKVVQSTYPLWEDVNAALRGPLSENGLSMSFDRRKEDGKTFIGCSVTHEMGHSRRAEIDLPRDESGSKNAVQGEGSTVSYGQRYSSKMLLNWVSEGTEDDDGTKAAVTDQNISEDQFDELQRLIDRAGIDESVVLTAEKIVALYFLPARRFAHVKAKLETTIKNRGTAQ